MITPHMATAELPGSDGLSENRIFAAINRIVVPDGVSPLDVAGDRSGWYADTRQTNDQPAGS